MTTWAIFHKPNNTVLEQALPRSGTETAQSITTTVPVVAVVYVAPATPQSVAPDGAGIYLGTITTQPVGPWTPPA
jgi:hypothetical protein